MWNSICAYAKCETLFVFICKPEDASRLSGKDRVKIAGVTKATLKKLSHVIVQTVSGSKPSERIRDISLFTSVAHFAFKRLSLY